MSVPGGNALPSANEGPPSAALGTEFESFSIFSQVAAKLGVRRRAVCLPNNPFSDPACVTIYNPTWLTVPRGLYEPKESVVAVTLSERIVIPPDLAMEAELLGPEACFGVDEERLVQHRLTVLRASMKPRDDDPARSPVLRQYRRPGLLVAQDGARDPVLVAASHTFTLEQVIDPLEFSLQQMDYTDWLGRLATQQLA